MSSEYIKSEIRRHNEEFLRKFLREAPEEMKYFFKYFSEGQQYHPQELLELIETESRARKDLGYHLIDELGISSSIRDLLGDDLLMPDIQEASSFDEFKDFIAIGVTVDYLAGLVYDNQVFDNYVCAINLILDDDISDSIVYDETNIEEILTEHF